MEYGGTFEILLREFPPNEPFHFSQKTNMTPHAHEILFQLGPVGQSTCVVTV